MDGFPVVEPEQAGPENGVRIWAKSSFDVSTIESRALGFMNMAMVKPLWEEIWIGIIGIFCALGLKQG